MSESAWLSGWFVYYNELLVSENPFDKKRELNDWEAWGCGWCDAEWEELEWAR